MNRLNVGFHIEEVTETNLIRPFIWKTVITSYLVEVFQLDHSNVLIDAVRLLISLVADLPIRVVFPVWLQLSDQHRIYLLLT